jgi:hypothetical protein
MCIRNRVGEVRSSARPATRLIIDMMEVLTVQAIRAATAEPLAAMRARAQSGCRIRGRWLRSSRPIRSREPLLQDSLRSPSIHSVRDSRGSISNRRASHCLRQVHLSLHQAHLSLPHVRLSLPHVPLYPQVAISVLSAEPCLHVRWHLMPPPLTSVRV